MMDTFTNSMRVSRLGLGRVPKGSFVNLNSTKGCKKLSRSRSCENSSTQSKGRSKVAHLASVSAVAEEGQTSANDGAAAATTLPSSQEAAVSTQAPEASSSPEVSSSTAAVSSNGEEQAASASNDSQTQESQPAQQAMTPERGGRGRQWQNRGGRGGRGGRGEGKVWRDPKSQTGITDGSSSFRRNSRDKPRTEFKLDQRLWQQKQGRNNRKRGPVKDFPFKVGDRVVGILVGGSNGWRVALEYDENIVGFCSIIELPHILRNSLDGNLPWQNSKLGLKREFVICEIPGDMEYNGRGPLLSARLVDTDVIWGRAAQLRDVCTEDRDVVTVNIRNHNQGGVLGVFEGLPLFVPWSFLPRRVDGAIGSREELVRTTVGKDLPLIIQDVDQSFNRFVANNVQALNIKAINKLKIGDLSWGFVNNITNFGAFLTLDELPSISALLHIRNISQVHINSVEDIFQIGDRVRVVVIGVDIKDSKLSLSTAELETYPGEIEQDKAKVFENAEETVKGYREYVAQEQERLKNEKAGQGQEPVAANASYAAEGATSSDDELNW